MSDERRARTLLDEIHGRSLWHIVLAYLGVSWGVLEAVALFTDRYGLATWLFTAALVLLGVGLVVVVATGLVGAGEHGTEAEGRSTGKGRSWSRAGMTLLAVCAVWGIIATFALVGARGETEALLDRAEVLAAMERHADAQRLDSAFALAVAHGERFGDDSAVVATMDGFSRRVEIGSRPSGATVHWRPPWTDGWEPLGSTPLAGARLPLGGFFLRFEAEGHEPLEIVATTAIDGTELVLAEIGSPNEGMVFVPGGDFQIQAPGLESLEAVPIDSYWIDRDEVTNAEYAAFVEAGAYRDASFWTEPFLDGGRELSFDEAMARFRDDTGLPGPATWVGGDYPDGADRHPVTGISWYEAVAYARFVDKAVPTIYHWNRAATTGRASLVLPLSNLSGSSPQEVASRGAVSGYGAHDMGGNAREWCSNASDGNRFILGGGWNDAPYMFMDAYTQSPWDRSGTNGVRLVRYEDGVDLSLAAREISRPTRDFHAEEPISDDRYATYLSLFAYDDTPLDVTVVAVDSSAADWVRETVTFDAAYGGERMEAVLFTPRNASPPHQTVVLFPGSNALFIGDTDRIEPGIAEFVPRSGRALLVPVYKGTYGRGGGELLDTDQPNETAAYRDMVVQWVRDLGRSVDYLETRPDIDSERLAYLGLSWGARMGVLMLAVEPRFRTAILYVGGLKHQRALPEADPASYVHRVTLPVLMLNGRYDHFFPLESSQIPLFELLGTPPGDKEHKVYDGGHSVPRPVLIRESLAWLERYLGPTGRR